MNENLPGAPEQQNTAERRVDNLTQMPLPEYLSKPEQIKVFETISKVDLPEMHKGRVMQTLRILDTAPNLKGDYDAEMKQYANKFIKDPTQQAMFLSAYKEGVLALNNDGKTAIADAAPKAPVSAQTPDKTPAQTQAPDKTPAQTQAPAQTPDMTQSVAQAPDSSNNPFARQNRGPDAAPKSSVAEAAPVKLTVPTVPDKYSKQESGKATPPAGGAARRMSQNDF